MQIILNLPDRIARRIATLSCRAVEVNPERVITELFDRVDALLDDADPYALVPGTSEPTCIICHELRDNPHLSTCLWGRLIRASR